MYFDVGKSTNRPEVSFKYYSSLSPSIFIVDLDRSAAALGCIMLGLQLCGVITSLQAAWTVITVLFTDCGTMFMIGGECIHTNTHTYSQNTHTHSISTHAHIH